MKKSGNIIYKITNKSNGKVYIGLTTQGLGRRMSEHKYRLSQGERDHKLYQAFRKYGIDNFDFEVVCTALDRKYLADLEVDFINKHNSFNRGYNMTIGGDVVSDETREKLSKIFKGRKITWYDKILESRRLNPNAKNPKDYAITGPDNKASKVYLIQFPSGLIEYTKGANQFCRDNGLTPSNLFATKNGGQNFHRGYRILGTFNDYPEREYTQAGGNGRHPILGW